MEPCGRDNLDEWLDRALREYGQAQPMAGLEGRILEHLAERRRVASPPRWWLVFAALGALAGVLAVLWVGRHSRPGGQSRPSMAALSHAHEIESPVKDNEIIRRSQATPTPHQRTRQRRILRVEVEQPLTPKLDQFPSRRPLSPEEQMLKRYVREFPEDAALVAREQAQLETEIEKRFAEITRENRSQEER